MKERHWTNLIESLRHAQCVLVLGAELPFLSDQPSPDDSADPPPPVTIGSAFARHLGTQLEQEARKPASVNLAAIAQQYEDTADFGASSLRSEAVAFSRAFKLQPSGVHRALAALPFKLIVTTAQDKHFEQVLIDSGKTPAAYRYHFRGDGRDNPEIPQPTSPSEPVIYHLFGDVLEPNSLVISENDLLDFLIAVIGGRPPLPNSLVRALQRVGQSFLFVGFGIREWYLRILLKVLVRALDLNRAGSAFALESLHQFADSDREQTLLYYQRGTRIELLDIDLATFVDQLATRFENAGGLIRDAKFVGPRPRVFICHAHEDARLAERLTASLLGRNLDPWLDQTHLEGGDLWEKRIESQLQDTDFVIVLHSAALAGKADSFVNKELALARDRGLRVRGSFVIPLVVDGLPEAKWVDDLRPFQQMPLQQERYNEHVDAVASRILREFQLRNR